MIYVVTSGPRTMRIFNLSSEYPEESNSRLRKFHYHGRRVPYIVQPEHSVIPGSYARIAVVAYSKKHLLPKDRGCEYNIPRGARRYIFQEFCDNQPSSPCSRCSRKIRGKMYICAFCHIHCRRCHQKIGRHCPTCEDTDIVHVKPYQPDSPEGNPSKSAEV